jgi:hypothetical protein
MTQFMALSILCVCAVVAVSVHIRERLFPNGLRNALRSEGDLEESEDDQFIY